MIVKLTDSDSKAGGLVTTNLIFLDGGTHRGTEPSQSTLK